MLGCARQEISYDKVRQASRRRRCSEPRTNAAALGRSSGAVSVCSMLCRGACVRCVRGRARAACEAWLDRCCHPRLSRRVNPNPARGIGYCIVRHGAHALVGAVVRRAGGRAGPFEYSGARQCACCVRGRRIFAFRSCAVWAPG